MPKPTSTLPSDLAKSFAFFDRFANGHLDLSCSHEDVVGGDCEATFRNPCGRVNETIIEHLNAGWIIAYGEGGGFGFVCRLHAGEVF